jgi:diguanylate cyclase (GGDEF)-like protein/PAS domain S-box-containing protein
MLNKVRSDHALNVTPLPSELPIRALFGLSDNGSQDWGEIRALQMSTITASSNVRAGVIIALGSLTALAQFKTVAMPLLVTWVLLNTAFAFWVHHSTKAMTGHGRRAVAGGEFGRIQLFACVGGLIWSAGFIGILFAGKPVQETLLALLSLHSAAIVLMIALVISLSTLPSLSIIFVSMVSVTAAGSFLWVGQPLLALGSIGIAVPLCIGVVRQCRAQILSRMSEMRLRDKSETVSLLLREFEDSGADWLWQTDTTRCAIHVSPRFAYALGKDSREVEGQPILKLVAGEAWETGNYPAELHEFADKLKKREAFSNLTVPVLMNGQQRWWELSASPRIADSGGFLGFRGVGSDVTEQCQSQEKISHLARFDTLTGLPNRLQVNESMTAALTYSEQWGARCAFMMIDLDRFKQVNDTLGHPVGDRLLAQVSKRLQALMGPNELCGRLGGDEFAVVVRDASDSTHISNLARSIIVSLSRPYEVDQHTIYIGASIGSAVGPRDGRSVEMLMRSADLALYRSKEDGRGVHNAYQPQLHAMAEERRLMEIELRHALDKDELHLVYQPVVDAMDGTLTGFEALMRWTNEKYGNVSPVKFIPLAEEARLIIPMGEWALRRACFDAVQWPSQVKVAVNVSADQLMSANFITSVVSALRDSGLPAQRLELEVTESLFLRDGGMAVQVLDQVLALGIKLSLDDFGTGYSSLGYLRKTRFNTIKVDRSFVTGAAKGVDECLAIIRAVVAMADSLKMSTTAEGVETEEELALIRQLGCKKIQGYLFGRPMSFNDTLPMFEPNLSHDRRDLYRKVELGG